MRLGSQTGSVMNHLMTTSAQVEPVVGMGATICCWTDRHAATIVKVTRCQIHVQKDNATRTDENGMSECQTYSYSPNPNAPVIIFRKTKRGGWRSACGNGLLVGHRRHYYDFSF
jgi:hypothetical protein